MPIYMPHMNSLALTMWQGVWYIDNNDVDANADTDTNAENNDNNASQLH